MLFFIIIYPEVKSWTIIYEHTVTLFGHLFYLFFCKKEQKGLEYLINLSSFQPTSLKNVEVLPRQSVDFALGLSWTVKL